MGIVFILGVCTTEAVGESGDGVGYSTCIIVIVVVIIIVVIVVIVVVVMLTLAKGLRYRGGHLSTTEMMNMIIQIMVKVIFILGIKTNEIRQGHLCKYF